MNVSAKRILENGKILKFCAGYINQNFGSKFDKYITQKTKLETDNKEIQNRIKDQNISIQELLKGVAPPSRDIPKYDVRYKSRYFNGDIIDNQDIFDKRFAKKYKELEAKYENLEELYNKSKVSTPSASNELKPTEIYQQNNTLILENKTLKSENSRLNEENKLLRDANAKLLSEKDIFNNTIDANKETYNSSIKTKDDEIIALKQKCEELKNINTENYKAYNEEIASLNLEKQLIDATNKQIIETKVQNLEKMHSKTLEEINKKHQSEIEKIKSSMTENANKILDFKTLQESLTSITAEKANLESQLTESQNKVLELTNENIKLKEKSTNTINQNLVLQISKNICMKTTEILETQLKECNIKLEKCKTQLDDCNRELNECKSKLQNAPPVPSTPPIQYYDLIESNMFDDVIAKGKLDLNIKGGGHKLFMKGGTHRLYDDEQYVAISKSKATALKNMIEQYQTKFSAMNDQLKTFTRTLILSMTASAKLNKDHLSEKIANMANQSIVSLLKQANDDLAKAKDDLTQANAKLEGEKTALEGEKTKLEGEKTKLEGEKKKLEGEKTVLTEEKTKLEGKNKELEKTNANLTKTANASNIATGATTALANAKASLQKFMSKDNRVMFEETKSFP